MADHSPEQTPPPAKTGKWKKRAVVMGVILAVVCKSLPEDYQGPCQIIAQICSGGLL